MTPAKKISQWLSHSSQATDMTQGKILPTIIAFAIPIMIGNLFQQLYSMVDTAVVGRGVGSAALAAVGVAFPVTQLLLGLVTGMTNGMSVVIAQHFGSDDSAKTKSAITNGIVLITGITILLTAAGILLCRGLFELINTPEELMDGAMTYTVIIFAGAAATAAYNYESGVLRAFGNSVIPLVFLVLTSLLNVGLDLLFVLAFRWGIAGAAAATVLSQLVSALLCFVYMAKKVPQVRFSKADWKISGGMMADHLRVGVPMAVFGSLLAVSFLVLQSALNALGSNDVAAYTAGSKMDTLVYQVLGAFGTAVSTFAAQNYGKGAMDRVREGVRKCLGITVIISLAMTGLVFLCGKYFMLLFIDPSETAVMASALQYIRITSIFYVILGVNFVVRFALTGVGKTVIPMSVGVTEILTRAAVTYLLVYRIGFLGMTFASPACWFTSTLLCVVCYAPMMKSAAQKSASRTHAA